MAGEIEEPFRFNFQADLLHSGSISFGRFESESLSWERRSTFSHNRYLEEVEKYSKPGSVTEKKAYFEAHFRRKALLKQSNSECQNGREYPTSENDGAHGLKESDNGNENRHVTYFDESPHSSVISGYDEETEFQKRQKENVEVPHGLEEYDNVNENMHFTYFDESPHSFVPSGYDEETKIQKRQKENMEVSHLENGNGSRHVAGFDERPHSLGNDEETKVQDCERQNREFFSVAPQDEAQINMVGRPVSVLEHVQLEETHQSETANVVQVYTEESKVTLTDNVEQVDVASEVNDLSLACHAAEKDDDSANSGPGRMFSPKVRSASESKLTKPKLKAQADVARFRKTISTEASERSGKPRISESEDLLRKKTEKKSPRPASPLTHSRVKTSKAEDSSMSVSEAKMLHGKKSIAKELKSEKAVKTQSSVSEGSLLGVRHTANRPKQTISLSKPHIIHSAAGISFKSYQRAESRKEEKAAVKMKQSRNSPNFKATPLPSFYNESARGSDRHKVIPTSKTPNRPPTPSNPAATRSNKIASNSSVPSDTRPSSSTSSTTRTHPPEARPSSSTSRNRPSETRPSSSTSRTRPSEARPSSSTTRTCPSEARPSSSTTRTRPPEAVRKSHIPEKKEPAARKEPRARDMSKKEAKAVSKSGYSAVSVVS